MSWNTRVTRLQTIIAQVILFSFLPLSVNRALAQAYTGTDVGGIRPDRNYFSQFDFELIDPKSGNLVLTFTDLVLPGNNGHDIVFQRTYSNQQYLHPDIGWSPRWSFGIAGMVMRILRFDGHEKNTVPSSFEMGLQISPVLVMADGSWRSTYWGTVGTVNGGKRLAVSADLLRFDPDTRRLEMPNGLVCDYDENGWLTHYTDVFGNHVWLNRTASPGQIIVTQAPNSPQWREVVLDVDGSGTVTKMTYLGREWHYTYGAGTATVTAAEGRPWYFESDAAGTLSMVRTPTGGEITYAYVDQDHWDSGGNHFTVRMLQSRQVGGQSVTAGTWQFSFTPYVPSAPWWFEEVVSRTTTIQTPSGLILEYDHFDLSPGPKHLGAGSGALQQRVIHSGSLLRLTDAGFGARPFFDAFGRGPVKIHGLTRHEYEVGDSGEKIFVNAFEYREEPTYPLLYKQLPAKITETRSDSPVVRVTTFNFGFTDPLYNSTALQYAVLNYGQSLHVDGALRSSTSMYYGDPAWTHPTSATPLGGGATTYARTALGNVASEMTNGKTTTYSYDWHTVSGIQSAGSTVTREINSDGTIAAETAAGVVTQYEYDDLGRAQRVDPPGGANAVVTTFLEASLPVRITTTRGTASNTTTLDGFGRPVIVEDGSGVRTTTTYDAEGRATFQSVPHTPTAPAGQGNQNIGTTVQYDPLGRVKKEIRANPASGGSGTVETQYTYGLNTVVVVDEQGRQTTRTFGPHGLETVVDPLSHLWKYEYDTSGRMRKIDGPFNSVTNAPLLERAARTWEYNDDQQLESETSPEAGTVTYEDYNDAGQLAKKKDANQTMFLYEYDTSHRLKKVTAGLLETTVTYQAGSDLIERVETNDNVQTTFAYDGARRPSGRTDTIDSKTFTTTYAYDADDRVSEVTYASGRRVRYSYDVHGRLSRVYNVETGQSYATGFAYHGSGALLGYATGNGLRTTYDLEPTSYRLSSIAVRTPGGSPVTLLGLTYEYDVAGNVKKLLDGRPNNTMDQAFAYDDLDRLTSATSPGTTFPANTFAYDAHGNRQTAGLGLTTYVYDQANPFRLLNIGGAVIDFDYDSNGNLESGPAFTYTYRPDNMMSSAAVGSTVTNFAYDGGAARIKKTTGGVPTYFLRGPDGRLLSEWKYTATAIEVSDYLYVGSQVIGVATQDLPLP